MTKLLFHLASLDERLATGEFRDAGDPVLVIIICYGFWNYKSLFAIHQVPSPIRKVVRLQRLSLLTYVDVRTAHFSRLLSADWSIQISVTPAKDQVCSTKMWRISVLLGTLTFFNPNASHSH